MLDDELWPRHWPLDIRMFWTGVFLGAVTVFAVLLVVMLCSVLAAG